MSTCTMMFLTMLGIPAALIIGVILYDRATAAVRTYRSDRPRARIARIGLPAFAAVVPVLVAAAILGFGWRESYPCGSGPHSHASATRAPAPMACLAR